MIFTISRKNMSQKLSLLLLIFGLIWGLMLLHYTFQQPRHQSSVKLREQILDLSKRYVKALAEENKNTVDVENGASMAGYADLKRTIAVLLDDILQRLVKLENKVDYIVVNGSATNTTNEAAAAEEPSQESCKNAICACGLWLWLSPSLGT
uniref:Coiled-coil domain containing 126 n=1 Tax=Sus scrofa TaxID=9823 RepID=A0A8D2C5Z7_PIG